ncbi:MAG: winged helix-turn-helix transcriptional regulator [Nitrospiraceae bacterium]|nr:winged helix-turn-helix transcriptional regulator [Nitrospiraceae bacterium]
MSYGSEHTGGKILYGRVRSELHLLERHMKMLRIIMDEGPVGIIKLSESTNLPQHKVRYSLRILEEEGLIRPSPKGATATDKTYEFMVEFKDLLEELEGRIEELKKTL